jgi:hypothetical protein
MHRNVEGFMHIRQLTAVTVLAAMGSLAGCGADEPGEPNAQDTSSYREDAADQAPAPEGSVPDVEGQTPGQETAGSGEQPRDDAAGQPEQQTGITEFAALDTDSDGMLAESEWQPEVLGGMAFEKIDEDSSGDIDREEFRQALAMAGEDTLPGGDPTSQSHDDPLDPTRQE